MTLCKQTLVKAGCYGRYGKKVFYKMGATTKCDTATAAAHNKAPFPLKKIKTTCKVTGLENLTLTPKKALKKVNLVTSNNSKLRVMTLGQGNKYKPVLCK